MSRSLGQRLRAWRPRTPPLPDDLAALDHLVERAITVAEKLGAGAAA